MSTILFNGNGSSNYLSYNVIILGYITWAVLTLRDHWIADWLAHECTSVCFFALSPKDGSVIFSVISKISYFLRAWINDCCVLSASTGHRHQLDKVPNLSEVTITTQLQYKLRIQYWNATSVWKEGRHLHLEHSCWNIWCWRWSMMMRSPISLLRPKSRISSRNGWWWLVDCYPHHHFLSSFYLPILIPLPISYSSLFGAAPYHHVNIQQWSSVQQSELPRFFVHGGTSCGDHLFTCVA